MRMKKLLLLLLLAGCATAPPQDETRMRVERLSPACENRGLEEWTPAWTACIRENYALQAPSRRQASGSAFDPPAYTHTYCTTFQGDKYNCVSF